MRACPFAGGRTAQAGHPGSERNSGALIRRTSLCLCLSLARTACFAALTARCCCCAECALVRRRTARYRFPRREWARFITQENHKLATTDALVFLDGCLRYDHQERLTAREAMQLPAYGTARLPVPSQRRVGMAQLTAGRGRVARFACDRRQRPFGRRSQWNQHERADERCFVACVYHHAPPSPSAPSLCFFSPPRTLWS